MENVNTKRLLLRQLTIKDAEQMFNNWASDGEVMKYMRRHTHKDIESVQSVINLWSNKDRENADTYHLGIVFKEDNKLIGEIAAVPIDYEPNTIRVSYCMSKKYWNKGIMTEALSAVIEFLFLNTGTKIIKARHKAENIASGKVMQKSGMKFLGIKKGDDKDKYGNLCDVASYEIKKAN